MSKVLSIRLQDDLYDELEEYCHRHDWTVTDGMRLILMDYLRGDGERMIETSDIPRTMNEQDRFKEKYDKNNEVFTISHRPETAFDDRMEFSGFFSGQEFAEYQKDIHNINSNGWYLELWTWTFLWCWWTSYGWDKVIPTDKIINLWRTGADPVQSALIEHPVGERDNDTMKKLFTMYLHEQGKGW